MRENPEEAVQIIEHVFKRCDALWTSRWRREEHNPDAWVAALGGHTFGAVSFAMGKLTNSGETWPPSLSDFLTWCRAWRPPAGERFAPNRLEQKKSSPETARSWVQKMGESLGIKKPGTGPGLAAAGNHHSDRRNADKVTTGGQDN